MNDSESLLFAKSIYSSHIIRQGIRDYCEICTIDLVEETAAYRCTFKNSVADLTLTAYEFANYLIELSSARSSGL